VRAAAAAALERALALVASLRWDSSRFQVRTNSARSAAVMPALARAAEALERDAESGAGLTLEAKVRALLVFIRFPWNDVEVSRLLECLCSSTTWGIVVLRLKFLFLLNNRPTTRANTKILIRLFICIFSTKFVEKMRVGCRSWRPLRPSLRTTPFLPASSVLER
jgi:hypothetical protein